MSVVVETVVVLEVVETAAVVTGAIAAGPLIACVAIGGAIGGAAIGLGFLVDKLCQPNRQRQEAERKQKALEAERKQKALEAERQQRALEAARQQRALEAARQQRALEAERQQKALEAERKQKALEAERQQRALEAARKQRALEAERQQKVLEAERQQRALEAEKKQKALISASVAACGLKYMNETSSESHEDCKKKRKTCNYEEYYINFRNHQLGFDCDALISLFKAFTTDFQNNDLKVKWSPDRTSGAIQLEVTYKCTLHEYVRHNYIVFSKDWSEMLNVAGNFIHKKGSLYNNRELWCPNYEDACKERKSCSCKTIRHKTPEKKLLEMPDMNLVYLKQCKICRTKGPLASSPQFYVGIVGTEGSVNTMTGRNSVYSSQFTKENTRATITKHYTENHGTGRNTADNVLIAKYLAKYERDLVRALTIDENVGPCFQESSSDLGEESDETRINPYFVALDNFILYRHGSNNYKVVRAFEVFYQWLFGVSNVMNKR